MFVSIQTPFFLFGPLTFNYIRNYRREPVILKQLHETRTDILVQPSLNKDMPIATYGDYGFALLLVPTAAADYLEYERFQLMDHIAPFIDAGKSESFSIDSINNESWLNNEADPKYKVYSSSAMEQLCV